MDRKEHGALRSGTIGASSAKTIMHGNAKAWDSLVVKLWDDGSAFAEASTGARAFGHEQEAFARAKFWERHTDIWLDEPEFVAFKRPGFKADHPYRRLLTCSPDMGLMHDSRSERGLVPVRFGGGEIKSPTTEGTHFAYVADMDRGNLPREHEDQVRMSLFVTNWPHWYFISHHGEHYKELLVSNNTPDQRDWELRFRPRLDAFIALYLEGKQPSRDKLNVKGLSGLLGL